jgi:hypothetical protein
MSFQTSPYEAPSPPETNGHPVAATPPAPAAAAGSAGPQIAQRFAWADLPQDAYPGFRVQIWTNFPPRLGREIASGDQEQIAGALSQIVVAHNGWIDFDGEPYPPASDPQFWNAIPNELAAVVINLVGIEIPKLAASLAATTRRG